MNAKPISSPHISSARRVDEIMRKVIFALLPALGFGIIRHTLVRMRHHFQYALPSLQSD